MKKLRVRTVERDTGWYGGWIARCPFTGAQLGGDDFVWNSRSVARCVVDEHRFLTEHDKCLCRRLTPASQEIEETM